MALIPFAHKRLLPENATQTRIRVAGAIDHTQAGTGSLYNYWLTGSNLESTLWIGLTGILEQYIDTEVRADANYKGNLWYEDGVAWGFVSIETENSKEATIAAYRGGEGAAAFNRDPWTDEQIEMLIMTHHWLFETHGIKPQRATGGQGRGLGYHSMWGTGPTPWIPYSSRGKQCPGLERIRQWNEIVLPALISRTGTKPKEGLQVGDKEDIIAALGRVEQRLGDRIAKAGADFGVVRRKSDGRVFVFNGNGKTHVEKEELKLLLVAGLIMPWPGAPNTAKIPVVDPEWIDDFPDADEITALVLSIKHAQKTKQ
jgi:hypothetical protein